jgi:hypothetical protein
MKTILIAGTEYPVKYGRKALQTVLSLAGAKSLKEAEKIDALLPDKWGQFVFAGIETGCRIAGQECPTLEQVDAALDDDLTIWTAAIDAFTADLSSKVEANTEGN